MMYPFVSIIIPTYREWSLLQQCLAVLNKQTYPSEKFEVIVVNNDPLDLAPSFSTSPIQLKIINEPTPGSYAARNTGIRMSKGEILGFTDSDCVPDENWIANAVDYLQKHPECTRVAGDIRIMYKDSKPTVVEMYNRIYAFPQQWLIANGGGSITGNLFTYRRVFESVGVFDEKLLSMGDVDWGRRAQRAGFNVHYVESVAVDHPSRNLGALIKKERRHGGGAANMTYKTSYISGILNLVYQFRPRVNALRFMIGRRKELRIRDRILIPLIRYYLLNIRAVEKFKVQMGKAPNRV